ncbi:MAG: S8 family serine peptidase [Saprospiraceae bacterium]|nr:S8 family serine peptidase [Saprospiraceae bacterium]
MNILQYQMVQFDWSQKIQAAVFKKWQATGGKGIKIAVLDTGVELVHPALAHLNQEGHKFNTAILGFNPDDPTPFGNSDVTDGYRKKGHGTQCVSVVSSKATPTDLLVGIAPLAELFIFKVNTSDNKFFRVKDFLKGLEAATKLGADIIVVSIAYSPSDLTTEGIAQAEVDRVFGLVRKAGSLLFSALPNMEEEESWVGIAANSFPSLRPESINIGVVSQQMLNTRKAEIEAEQGVHLLVSNSNGTYCKIGGLYVQEPISSSYGTYLVAGIAALYLASKKKEAVPTNNPTFSATSDAVKAISQKFVKLANAPILDTDTPVFFKKSLDNA